MVIWPEFRMGQYWVNDHPYHVSQFTTFRLGPFKFKTVSFGPESDPQHSGSALPRVRLQSVFGSQSVVDQNKW